MVKAAKRLRLFRHPHSTPPGSAPGTLVAPPEAPPSVVTVTAVDESHLTEIRDAQPEGIRPLLDAWPLVWVNVDGLGSTDVVEGLGALFGLHPLALEDVLNPHHRAKVEIYDTHAFAVLRMARVCDGALNMEQVSLFFADRYVLSFQERAGDAFDAVRERLRAPGRRQRFLGPDYLAYALIDSLIDGYYPVLEWYSDLLAELEDTVLTEADAGFVARTQQVKRDIQMLQHGIWPMRETVRTLATDPRLVGEDTRRFLDDCYDHVIHVIDILETYRERANGLTDLYLSNLSNRMNEVMKVLTMIATIFIPLSFLAGLYGMNFDPDVSPYNMPELRTYFGYPIVLGAMAVLALGFVLYFWRKGWLGGGK